MALLFPSSDSDTFGGIPVRTFESAFRNAIKHQFVLSLSCCPSEIRMLSSTQLLRRCAVRHPMSRCLVSITQTKATKQSPTKQQATTIPDSTPTSPVELSQSKPPTHKLPLTITQACWNRIRELKDHDNNNKFLRVVVDAGGCSGFSYHFELDDSIEEGDHIYDDEKTAKVVVDDDSLELIQGSTIDYEVSMMKSAFKVSENPQSESACGCGSSFAVKKFASNPALD